MRRITSRFVMLIATAAVAPLVIYGAVSMAHLRTGIEESVKTGNTNVATQVASQLQQYVDTNARILRSVGEELAGIDLAPWQQERILKNHVLEFPEFREISFFDPSGRLLATSRVAQPSAVVPAAGTGADGVNVSQIFEDEDNLPATDLTLALRAGQEDLGWLVARLSLEELWRFVDGARVGREGFALVVSDEGQLVAHGNPSKKRLVALPSESQRALPEVQLLARVPPGDQRFVDSFTDSDGRHILVTGARVPGLGWNVMVEQPADEAFGVTAVLQRQLLAAILLALLGTVVLGWFWARSFITRISALKNATGAIAEGRLDERVAIGGRDEIRQLGDSFNAMADKLVELQENVRKQERQAMFGRIAAGLVHDLSHPIQNIGNSCKLIVKLFDDLEYRETFRRTVEREMVMIKRVLEDLHNIARPIPLERFPVDMNRAVSEVVESMQQHAETAGITLRAELSPESPFIDGDVFALGRVYRNLILNAIQATAPGGVVSVAVNGTAEQVHVRVQDTGCGIPPDRLSAIFDDFVTTKRRGLGLGLAISKKIVEQLGGQISVASEVGRGTTFELRFERARARPMLVAG
jgi:signal transduction histidine kinase